MTEGTIPPDIAAMSFEDALSELEEIVRRLESGSGKLEDAIQAAERGALLKRHCEETLKEARLRVDRIVLSPDGEAGTEPMDAD